MQPRPTNSFARAARAEKLAKLLEAADLTARQGGLDPYIHAVSIAECWKRATREHFARLAVLAACHPPSATTVAEFLEALERRAVRGAA